MVIDPNNSTPPNHFINNLTSRMSVYYHSKIHPEETHLEKCTTK